MKKRVRLLISGLVQGVFYRASAVQTGKRLGLSGYASNLADGSVEVVAEGEEPSLIKLIEWCRKGPPAAHVSDVEAEWSEATNQFVSFQVR